MAWTASRSDIILLATAVQKWSRNHDRQLARLIAHINSSTHYRLFGVIKDNPQDLHLLCTRMPTTLGKETRSPCQVASWFSKDQALNFPLAWLSKRQTPVSRPTTEAEVVSLAYSLNQEGLPSLSFWERLLGRPVELVLHENNQTTILVAKKGYPSALTR